MCKSVREKTPSLDFTRPSLYCRVKYAELVTSSSTKVCCMFKQSDRSVIVWLFSAWLVLTGELKMLFFVFPLNSLDCGSSSADRYFGFDASISLLDAFSVTMILTSLSCSKNLWEKVTESYLLELKPPPPPLFKIFGPCSDIPQLFSLSLCPCLFVSQPFMTKLILRVTDLGSSIDGFNWFGCIVWSFISCESSAPRNLYWESKALTFAS